MINLNQLEKAFALSQQFNIPNFFQKIGTLSMKQNNLNLAIKSFQMIKNVSMVLSLKKLQKQKPGTLVYLGDLSLILCDYVSALQFYFMGGFFEKILFLCEELKDYNLGLDMLRYIQENHQYSNIKFHF
jgi:hypothetical protein